MIKNPEQKIRHIRELKNYSQEYLANKIGLTTRAYSKIESGETQLTINRLNEISEILGVTPTEILGFDEKQVFNNCKQDGNNIGITQYISIPDKLIEQYENQISNLKEEVKFLRETMKRVQ